MKKFDIHCHVTAFPDYCPPRPVDWKQPGDHVNNRYLSLEQQIAMHDTLDVAMGVLLCGGSPERIWEIVQNEEAKFLADQRPDRFVWFFNIDPRQGDFNTRTDFSHIFSHYKALGARGLGEISATLPVDGPLYDNYWRQAAEFELPVLLHVSPWLKGQYGVFDQMGHPGFDRMLSKHKDLKIIGHSMAWWSEMGADLKFEEKNKYPKGKIIQEGAVPRLMRKHENLYCDLSAGSGTFDDKGLKRTEAMLQKYQKLWLLGSYDGLWAEYPDSLETLMEKCRNMSVVLSGKAAADALLRDPDRAVAFLERFADRIYYGTAVYSKSDTYPFTLDAFLSELVSSGRLSESAYAKIIRQNAESLLQQG